MATLNLRCNNVSESVLTCLEGLYDLSKDKYLVIENWKAIGDCWMIKKGEITKVRVDY